MKVAVQLAANPRSFKRCYPAFKKNIVDTLNPDIFLQTWRLNGNERPDVTTDGSCEDYVNLYQPTAYQIDDLTYDYQPLQTMVPHFTARFRANQLRKKYEEETGVKYDVVICARPDVRLINPPLSDRYAPVRGSEFLPEYIEAVKENEIWIHHFKQGIPSDYFFYTTPKWMDITTDCYFEMDKLKTYQPGSERLWWHKLQKEGFKRENFRYFGNSVHDTESIEKSFRFFDIECVR